ncbi:MAG: glycosyltransferase [Solobacterium sp.]|nr:glycosyltransferase [Solobacterium sp.]
MKYLLINEALGVASTGKITAELAAELEKQGHEVRVGYGRGHSSVPEWCRKYGIRIGSDYSVLSHIALTRITDRHGQGSKHATRVFLKKCDAFDPDVVWLHNLHGYYIHYGLLFDWIKSRPKMKVYWTLHDCWAFTGHCAHFVVFNCDKWRTLCDNCPAVHRYPSSFTDRSRQNYLDKKKAFTGVSDLTIYTPSEWLKALVEQSFLGCYPVTVRPNTLDHTVFHPVESTFRKDRGLENRIVLLSVANVWGPLKGLADLLELSKMLDDRFVMVLVGLDQKTIETLPANMIGIQRTRDGHALAELYSTGDLLINPSRAETFGMTVLEAQCCGTKAIVYQGTACVEVLGEDGGWAVEPGAVHIYDKLMEIYPPESEEA